MTCTPRRISTLLPAIALLALALALPSTASAQATRTWVSGVGDDANPCSRTAPCKTFAGAISKTAAKGEINCLDPGGFGGVTITKSLTIACEYTEGGVLVSGTNAIVVNAAATDNVTLRGLDINGIGTGLNAVRVLQAKRVRLIDSRIFGFVRNGFDFEPSNANAKGSVLRTTITDVTGNGVVVAPTSTGNNARVTVKDSLIADNGCGLTATNHTMSAAFNFAVDCGTSNVVGGSANINAFNNSINDNDLVSGAFGSAGVFTHGQTSIARISGNTITGNNFGLRAIDVGAGGIFSFSNNAINGNATNGTPNGTVPLTKRK